jgi:sigma-B regulation protein RsbU (phosphoserine phosphatase)
VFNAADVVGALLGTLFITLGLAAIGGAHLRSDRRDRSLIWFGVFTLLYGVRLSARSAVIDATVRFNQNLWNYVDVSITYFIFVPAVLLVLAIFGPGPRRVLHYLWRLDLLVAIVAITWDLTASQPGRAMFLNPPLVFGNVAIFLATLAPRAHPRTWSRDAWLVVGGLAIFTVTALYETVRGGMFGRWNVEPFAMLILIVCLGYVAATRVFANERRIAAVSRELETARRIQQSILPKHHPSVIGLRVASHYEPMTEVAGDLFDFVVTPSGRLGVLVADVSGHGVPAAIIASMVKIGLATQRDGIEDPGAVLTQLNRALYGQFELAYVTATFLLLDPGGARLAYASAGHPPSVLVRRSGGIERLDRGGMVLGFMPEMQYATTGVHDLAPGDRILLYTDGLTEASREGGEFFGDRQLDVSLAAYGELPLEQFTRRLVDAARAWAGVPSGALADDVTVVAIELTG